MNSRPIRPTQNDTSGIGDTDGALDLLRADRSATGLLDRQHLTEAPVVGRRHRPHEHHLGHEHGERDPDPGLVEPLPFHTGGDASEQEQERGQVEDARCRAGHLQERSDPIRIPFVPDAKRSTDADAVREQESDHADDMDQHPPLVQRSLRPRRGADRRPIGASGLRFDLHAFVGERDLVRPAPLPARARKRICPVRRRWFGSWWKSTSRPTSAARAK